MGDKKLEYPDYSKKSERARTFATIEVIVSFIMLGAFLFAPGKTLATVLGLGAIIFLNMGSIDLNTAKIYRLEEKAFRKNGKK